MTAQQFVQFVFFQSTGPDTLRQFAGVVVPAGDVIDAGGLSILAPGTYCVESGKLRQLQVSPNWLSPEAAIAGLSSEYVPFAQS